jgi:protocatechuate 3,4-dioxygenase alpha subunit
MPRLGLTPPQTIGPFFHYALPLAEGGRLVADDDPRAIRIVGVVRDGAGAPVSDAMIETWQADAAGRYAHPADDRDGPGHEPGFSGFGRVETDADGAYEIVTVKPGRVPGADGTPQAPHIALMVHARGVLRHLVTRVYFPDEDKANAADPALSAIGDAARAERLVAIPENGGLRFDIHIQGECETPFFMI